MFTGRCGVRISAFIICNREWTVLKNNVYRGILCSEDYCKPIWTISVFDNKNDYIEHESKGDKDTILSVKEHLDTIRSYLSDLINNHKTEGEWKIQLTTAINFMSSEDSEETSTVCTKSHNIEFTMGDKTEEIIESLLQNYQKDLEESMKGSEFVLDSIDLLYYHLQKISLNRGGSYIDSPIWLKK